VREPVTSCRGEAASKPVGGGRRRVLPSESCARVSVPRENERGWAQEEGGAPTGGPPLHLLLSQEEKKGKEASEGGRGTTPRSNRSHPTHPLIRLRRAKAGPAHYLTWMSRRGGEGKRKEGARRAPFCSIFFHYP